MYLNVRRHASGMGQLVPSLTQFMPEIRIGYTPECDALVPWQCRWIPGYGLTGNCRLAYTMREECEARVSAERIEPLPKPPPPPQAAPAPELGPTGSACFPGETVMECVTRVESGQTAGARASWEAYRKRVQAFGAEVAERFRKEEEEEKRKLSLLTLAALGIGALVVVKVLR